MEWAALDAAAKQPFIDQAEKAKAENLRLYPQGPAPAKRKATGEGA